MGVKIKEVTGKEIYEAIEADGFGAMRGKWFEKTPDGKTRACLLGTAALNLGVEPNSSSESLLAQLNKHNLKSDSPWYKAPPEYAFPLDYNRLGDTIIAEFDKKHPIETEIEKLISADLNGNWNFTDLDWQNSRDKVISEGTFEDEYIRSSDGNFYNLPTWNDALRMAKEVLQTVWNEKFKILEYDFEVDFNNYVLTKAEEDGESVDDYEPDEDPYYGGF